MVQWIVSGLGRIIRWWNRWRALRLFRGQLGPALLRRYGRSDTYTPAQIARTIEAIGAPDVDLGFAYAMFTDRHSFAAFKAQNGETWDYDAMRDVVHSFGHHTHAVHHHMGHHDVGHHHHDAGGGHHHGHDVYVDTSHHHH